MKRPTGSRPSPALVVAILALVAALAGTAVAEVATTSKLDKQEKKKVKKISNKQINKRFPIATGDISNNAVTTPKIAGGAVTSPKLGAGAVTASKLGNLTVRVSDSTPLPPDAAPANGFSQALSTEARCQAGEVAIGGGVRQIEIETDGAQDGHVVATRFIVENGKPVGMLGRAGHDTGSAVTSFTVEVLCLAA
jgi:hypothetical protein